LIPKRKQRWGLSLPLINRERNFIAKTKSQNWNCKNEKKGERDERAKTKNGNRRERRESLN